MIITFNDFIIENLDNDIWYHGSYNDDITTFKTRRDRSKNRLGSYFSSSEKESKRYGKYIYRCKLNTQKTLDLTKFDEVGIENYENLLNELPIPDKERNLLIRSKRYYGHINFIPYKILEDLDRIYHIVPKLKNKGYDSIKFMENGSITAVVFYPSLIQIIDMEEREEKFGW